MLPRESWDRCGGSQPLATAGGPVRPLKAVFDPDLKQGGNINVVVRHNL
jgi:hypothetical protein